jgi:hypothetical protein
MNPLGLQSKGLILIIMFITNTALRSQIPNPFSSPEEQYWLAVELALHNSFFLVTIREMESIRGVNVPLRLNTMLVANVIDIERLAQQNADSLLQFVSAMIMTPARINGTGTWKMEPLTAVWVADEPEVTGAKVEICETNSGAKYITSISNASLDKLINQHLRYRFPVLQ